MWFTKKFLDEVNPPSFFDLQVTALSQKNFIKIHDLFSGKKYLYEEYDTGSFANVLKYQILYILLNPFIGIWEIWRALKSSLTRDFGWFSGEVNPETPKSKNSSSLVEASLPKAT